jgi:hypothetical protein
LEHPAKAPPGAYLEQEGLTMAENSGGSGGGGGLYFIVGALVVVVGVIGFVALGGHMPHSGGGAPSKVELNVTTPTPAK